jgi:hypothetical protein
MDLLQQNEFFELMTRDEKIHPDLAPYLMKGLVGGKFLNHPLVQELTVDPNKAAFVNKRYEVKKKFLADAFEKKNFHNYIFAHERPYRFLALKELVEKGVLDAKQHWENVGSVWIDSENVWQHLVDWKKFWSNKLPNKEHCMDEDERKALASLPNTLEVFRGFNGKGNRKGLSWTLDRDKALYFAGRYKATKDQPKLVTGTVEKRFVHAYFTGRDESEIVSEKVRVRHTEIVS